MPQMYLKEIEPFIVAPKKKKWQAKSTHVDPNIGEQKVYNRHTTKRSTSLIAADAALVILEFFQVLALLQAMSLKWFWPQTWISKANFIFAFNADVWEYIKVDCGAFIGIREYDTPSTTVATNFYYILFGWSAFFMLMSLIWASVKIFLHVKKPAYFFIYNARLQRAIIVITQIIALPFGVSAFKVFHCTSDGQMSVENDVQCWSGMHWAYIGPVVVAVLVVFVVFSAWLFWRIRHEAMTSADQHHEDFVKLKEVEYMSGLDVVWAVHGFHLFTSFRLRAIYYRPTVHLVKLLLLILYAATFQNIIAQAVCAMVFLVAVALLVMLLRPFRLVVFNVVMAIGYFCLTGDAVFGTILTQFDPTKVESAWLVEPYSLWIMIALNAVLLVGTVVVFIVYLFAYRFCCQGRCILQPLWPVMTSYQYDVEGVETQKYLSAVLRGRALIERCRRLPAMFTPVHEMAHQICVLNAYMRESELLHDGLHPTLWAVLDEMMDMHHRLEPRSLFGEMVHESIRKNAAHFMAMMPMFSQRLAQRDYDLVLVSPVRKRLLLKMYIIALWWDGTEKRKTHQELTQKVLTNIWEESPEIVEAKPEREYHEELYPGIIQGPDTEALYATGTLDLGHGLYDLEAVEDEEESLVSFLKRSPPALILKEEEDTRPNSSCSSHSQHDSEAAGADNPAFIPDNDVEGGGGSEEDGASRSSVHVPGRSLTTAEVEDTSEAPPDVLVDLEMLAEAREQASGEATVELSDYPPGESTTDEVLEDGADDEGTDQSSSAVERRDTGASLSSTKSKSNSASSKSKVSGRSATSRRSSSSKSSAAARSPSPAKPKPKVKAARTKSAKGTATGKKTPKKK